MNGRILLLILTLVLPASQAHAYINPSVATYKLGEYLGIASYQASVGEWHYFNDAIRAAQTYMYILSSVDFIPYHDIMSEVQSAQSHGYHAHDAIATLRDLYKRELRPFKYLEPYDLGLNIGIARGHASGGSDWGKPNLERIRIYIWGGFPIGRPYLKRCEEAWDKLYQPLNYAIAFPMNYEIVIRVSQALSAYVSCDY